MINQPQGCCSFLPVVSVGAGGGGLSRPVGLTQAAANGATTTAISRNKRRVRIDDISRRGMCIVTAIELGHDHQHGKARHTGENELIY